MALKVSQQICSQVKVLVGLGVYAPQPRRPRTSSSRRISGTLRVSQRVRSPQITTAAAARRLADLPGSGPRARDTQRKLAHDSRGAHSLNRERLVVTTAEERGGRGRRDRTRRARTCKPQAGTQGAPAPAWSPTGPDPTQTHWKTFSRSSMGKGDTSQHQPTSTAK